MLESCALFGPIVFGCGSCDNMGDEWDDDVDMTGGQVDVVNDSTSNAGDSPRGKKRGHGKAKAKGKAKASACRKGVVKCFALKCEEKKLYNSKWCRPHHRKVEAMRYQAQNSGDRALQVFNEVMGDPAKAQVAIADFERENPEGQFRKRVIDWGAFQRRHGVRTSWTMREEEVQVDVTGYWMSVGMPKGVTREESDAEFWEKARVSTDKEGEGANTRLWVAQPKRRMRDETRYVDNEFVEGSKQVKDMCKDAKEDMKQMAKQTMVDHSNAFFSGAASSSSAKALAIRVEVDNADKVKWAADVNDEAPRHYGKLNKEVPGVVKAFNAAVEKLRFTMESTKDEAGGAEFKSYWDTGMFRLRLGLLMQAESAQRANQLLAPGVDLVKLGDSAASSGTPPAQPVAALLVAAKTEEVRAEGVEASPAPPQGEQPSESAPATSSPKDANETAEEGPNATPQKAKSTAASSEAGGSASKRKVSDSERVSLALREEIRRAGRMALVVQQADALCCHAHIFDLKESLLSMSTLADMEKVVATIKASNDQAKMLREGLSKSAANLKSHVDGLKRRIGRERAKQQRDNDQKEVDAVRKKARDAAEKVKIEETEVPHVYKIEYSILGGAAEFDPVVVVKKAPQEIDVDSPALFEDMECIDIWNKEAKVQLALGNWGGRYKRSDIFKEEGRAQLPLYAREGKEESAKCFSAICDVAMKQGSFKPKDGSKLEGVASNVWLYGCKPGLKGVVQTPNGLGVCRILSHGEVLWLLFPAKKLVEALRALRKEDKISWETIVQSLEGYSIDKLKELKSHGCPIKYVMQKPSQCLYMPPGYIAVEHCIKGVLVYGARQTVLIRSSLSFDNYEALISVLAASGRAVQRMEEALEAMSPDAIASAA